MRYALISDIHGKKKNLIRVLKAIEQHEVDHIFCLGDIFECKVGKSKAQDFRFAFVDQIVNYEPKLTKKLRQVSCIIGNQEERIRQLLPREQTDEKLRYYLTLPPAIELPFARLEHGHRFIQEQNGAPYPNQLNKHLLFFGHTHQSALYQFHWVNRKWQPKAVSITFGVPYELNLVRYWGINIGAVVSPRPEWVLYEEAGNRVTFYREEEETEDDNMD